MKKRNNKEEDDALESLMAFAYVKGKSYTRESIAKFAKSFRGDFVNVMKMMFLELVVRGEVPGLAE